MFYEQDDISENTMEVILNCVDGQEYIYWVSLADMPSEEDEYDWSIQQARAFHSKIDRPICPEDTEDDCYAEALEPFPRDEQEFMWIK